MFIGHNAVGFGAKPFAPRTSLGLLMAAPMLPDLIWPVFLLTGIEHVRIDPGNTRWTPLDFYDYPWSHSLLMCAVWGLIFGGGYWLWTRYTRGAIALAIGVLSHWLFDFITHRPDMPLYPGGGPKVGLGLWNFPAGTLVTELALFAIGFWLYVRSTRAKDRIGSIGMWAFIAVLLFVYAGAVKGDPPPNEHALAWFGLGAWLLVVWPWWFDRHREAIE